MSREQVKARLLEYRIRKLVVLLQGFGVKVNPEVRVDEATAAPYLKCTLDGVVFRFPLTRLGRRFERELQRLDRLCYAGIIPLEKVQTLLISLSTAKNVYEHRAKLRKATGIVKDKRLRNWIVFRRVRATELMRGKAK